MRLTGGGSGTENVVLSHLDRVSGGVALLFSRNFLPKSYELEERIKGRLMVVRAKYELFTIVFINVHAQNSGLERVQLLNDLNVVLNQCGPEEFLFLGGDFNCTENDQLDRNHLEPHAASKRALKQQVETHRLTDDLWREMHQENRQYTWVSPQEPEAVLKTLNPKKPYWQTCSKARDVGPVSLPERCTDGCTVKFLLWPGEEERQSRFIHALRSDKGQLLTEAGEIRRRAVQFYAQLYQSEYTEDEGAFNSSCSRLPRVSEETNKELEGPLTSEEVFAVLQNMKGGKAPGIDGLPPEFYRAFSFRGAQ
ncbi:hypothetical protein L3Q82_002225 [Scortum barcoo]|uniref:Uncharacterized protein n=1 Tax=Scortum barcoo TaxID=214431 RepID=A0ACB8W3U8_9TELE|nr:hypothetical protein L3Q82_002225 [Scortum barcoo]